MSVTVAIEWLEDVPERARKIFNTPPTSTAPESWWDGRYLPGLGVAEEGLRAIVQVWADGRRLFELHPGGVEGRALAVPYVLWQMRRAVQVAAAGERTVFGCPPLHDPVVLVQPVSRKICMSSQTRFGNPICSPASDWEDGIIAAEYEVRQWILQHLPELADDEVLGPWLRGGGAPDFLPLVGKWVPEWDDPHP